MQATGLPELSFRFGDTEWRLGKQPLLMGIVNVTPDSFSDGGQFFDTDTAVRHGVALAAAGAQILDVGGESTRPGAPAVPPAEEIRRVVPVIQALRRETAGAVSIATSKAAVAAAALAAGATIVNDGSGLHRDPAMFELLRRTGAGCVVMHMRGTPATMQQMTQYDDLVGDICRYFEEVLAAAESQGIPRDRFMLDPGIGFAKTPAQNLQLIANLYRFRALGRPVLAGPSRKSFIGALLGGKPPPERVWGTAGAVAACVLRGADVLRVHDVREMHDVAVVAAAIRDTPMG